MIYMQARYYDSVSAVFISADPVRPRSGSVFNFNRYIYANSNPLIRFDPDGKDNQLGIFVRFSENVKREPTASDRALLAAAQLSVDLTVEAVPENGSDDQCWGLSEWTVIADPTNTVSPISGKGSATTDPPPENWAIVK